MTSWMALREYDQQQFDAALWAIDTSPCYGDEWKQWVYTPDKGKVVQHITKRELGELCRILTLCRQQKRAPVHEGKHFSQFVVCFMLFIVHLFSEYDRIMAIACGQKGRYVTAAVRVNQTDAPHSAFAAKVAKVGEKVTEENRRKKVMEDLAAARLKKQQQNAASATSSRSGVVDSLSTSLPSSSAPAPKPTLAPVAPPSTGLPAWAIEEYNLAAQRPRRAAAARQTCYAEERSDSEQCTPESQGAVGVDGEGEDWAEDTESGSGVDDEDEDSLYLNSSSSGGEEEDSTLSESTVRVVDQRVKSNNTATKRSGGGGATKVRVEGGGGRIVWTDDMVSDVNWRCGCMLFYIQ
jgi:hypothetical protein